MTRNERLLITEIRKANIIRPHVRHALPPFLLLRPVQLIGNMPDSTDQEREWAAPIPQHLVAAAKEPLLELSQAARDRAEWLLNNIARHVMAEATEGQPRKAIWAALMILYWLADDEEHGLLVPESHLHHAVYTLIETANEHEGIVDRYGNSARKAVKRLKAALERIELFPAAQPMREAA